jgi:hypothetical protein
MNYYNFASRLSIPRRPATASVNESPKLAPRKPRKGRPRPVTVAAMSLLCLFALGAEAGAQTDGPRSSEPPPPRINVPTLLITLTGLGVALLRIPMLWRSDVDC